MTAEAPEKFREVGGGGARGPGQVPPSAPGTPGCRRGRRSPVRGVPAPPRAHGGSRAWACPRSFATRAAPGPAGTLRPARAAAPLTAGNQQRAAEGNGPSRGSDGSGDAADSGAERGVGRATQGTGDSAHGHRPPRHRADPHPHHRCPLKRVP